MNRPVLVDDLLSAKIEYILGESIERAEVVEKYHRLYSDIQIIDVFKRGRKQRLIAKSWAHDSPFRMQVEALARARQAFVDRRDINIPYLGKDHEQRMLFMDYVQDQSMSEHLLFSGPPSKRVNLLSWRKEVIDACQSVGRWLREWHTVDARCEPISQLLMRYMSGRPDYLALLDQDTNVRLNRLVSNLDTGIACAVHGDFTPPNVLWSPSQLTVLDFGVSEWKNMTPAWDHCSMDIGLERELKFSLRSPGHWVPTFAASVLNAFRRGYGELPVSQPTKHACRAVRHLVLFGNDVNAPSSYDKRATWHLDQLKQVLLDAER